jgi:[acyl-carrier-protein] S-malonyltransferase
MGRDLIDRFPKLGEILEAADAICGKPITRLCSDGSLEELTLTENLQPAITAVSLVCLKALHDAGLRAHVCAGHSLGEYSALVCAGVLDIPGALSLVNKRGMLMHREAQAHPGAMAAVIGLPIEAVQEVVAQAAGAGILAVANHNTAEQVVVTGETEPLSRAVQAAKKMGGKAVPLKVSGAWHCRLMEGAVAEFREFMEGVPFHSPGSEVLFNATAEREEDPARIKDIMARQLVSPVRWHEIMLRMLETGVSAFLEVGPKNVLTGLLKKTTASADQVLLLNVEDGAGLDRCVNALLS